MRDNITAAICTIQPYDALEATHLQQALQWIASGAPLYRLHKPAVPPQHLVSYFVLCDPSKRQLLLVDHRNAQLWLPSGGHVEPDEDPRATVEREVAEELQIAATFLLSNPLFLTITETVGRSAGHTDVSLWYVLRGNCEQPLHYDTEEFVDIAWFALEQLPWQRTDPHMARFAAKLAAYLNGGDGL